MNRAENEKHANELPSARKIKRACRRELYRTSKKLKIWIPPEQMIQAEDIYYRKVVMNLPWIVENGSNRKALADWFADNVSPEIAAIWNVEEEALSAAFRSSFGG